MRGATLTLWLLASSALAGEVVSLPQGTYAPLFGLDVGQTAFPLGAFKLDVRPVSRAEAWHEPDL